MTLPSRRPEQIISARSTVCDYNQSRRTRPGRDSVLIATKLIDSRSRTRCDSPTIGTLLRLANARTPPQRVRQGVRPITGDLADVAGSADQRTAGAQSRCARFTKQIRASRLARVRLIVWRTRSWSAN